MANPKTFRALWVQEGSSGQFTRSVIERRLDDLPAEPVLVRVKYSSLNYKDALSAFGNRGVTRRYPHTPGIDAAGVIVESTDPALHPGDEVIIAGVEFGVSVPGGYSQYVRVPSSWILPLPHPLTLRQSMAFGTAGFTAAMCVDRIQHAGLPASRGEILVTGATGGVGSISVAILAREGYQVTAATGKPEKADLLRKLGASQVIHRDEVLDSSDRPLLHARWAGVVDTIGGAYLASAVRAAQPEAVITACGNASSPDLPLTVFPFILRGVSLFGIDATRPSREECLRLWNKLSAEWKIDGIEDWSREVTLNELETEILRMLQGKQTGRVVVNLG
jgi:putative YhdH/YhfP family quinone oxidoreductase